MDFWQGELKSHLQLPSPLATTPTLLSNWKNIGDSFRFILFSDKDWHSWRLMSLIVCSFNLARVGDTWICRQRKYGTSERICCQKYHYIIFSGFIWIITPLVKINVSMQETKNHCVAFLMHANSTAYWCVTQYAGVHGVKYATTQHDCLPRCPLQSSKGRQSLGKN